MGHFMPWISIEKLEFEKKMRKNPKEAETTTLRFGGFSWRGEDDLLLDAFLDHAM